MRAISFGGLVRALVVTSILAAASAPAESASIPAYYLVVEVGADGSAAIASSTVVTLDAPLRSLSAAEISARATASRRMTDVVAVTLRDGAGRSVYRSAVAVPKWLRGEFHAQGPWQDGESNIDGHVLPAGPRTFVVRVPYRADGTLTLESGPLTVATSLPLASLARAAAAPPPPPSAVSPLGAASGDPGNRVDLLILGEGYTLAERSKFQSDASALADSFFDVTPYDEYRNYVNVSTLFIASAQSGADQPPYRANCNQYDRVQSCCGDADASGAGSASVDTAFDGTYCSFNIQRLVTVDAGKVLEAAAAAPDWDQILVLVNDLEYGGSGGLLSVISTNPFAVEVAQHEIGHSFTGLADEYSTPYPGFPTCSDVSGPPCERNITDRTAREHVKWERWIAPSTPIPSLGPLQSSTDAGLWEGARYLDSGIYRQGFDCLMRSLGTPFCDVAAEAFVLRLYEGGWGTPSAGIDNVEPGSESPAPGVVDVPPSGQTFSAVLLGPQAGPAMTAEWRLDGALVATQQIVNGGTASYTLVDPAAGHALELRAIDNSPILHDDVRATATSTRFWNIAATLCAGVFCPPVDDQCTENVCDPADGQCKIRSRPDGASCGDGQFCNGVDHCIGGTCSLHVGDPCVGPMTCNEDTDLCEPIPGLTGEAAVAAGKCQQAIHKASLRLAGKRLQRLAKCADGVFKCVQTKEGAGARDQCVVQAGERCRKELGTARDRDMLTSAIRKRCEVPVLTIDDLRAPQGLGYASLEDACGALARVTDIAACVGARQACLAEELFGVEAARAGELIELAGVDLPSDTCLVERGSGGGDLGDPKGAGKAVVKCVQGIEKAGRRFVTRRLKALEACTGALFTCVQTKPGDLACVAAADRRCDREYARIGAETVRLYDGIQRRCATADLPIETLLDPAGANLGALGQVCGALATSPSSHAGYAECVVRQHTLRVDEMLRIATPRAAELLAGRPPSLAPRSGIGR